MRVYTEKGVYHLKALTKVEISLKRSQLTQTCKVTLPKNVRWDGQKTLPLKRGNAVEVYLGYDGNNELAFSGYLTGIGVQTPMELTMEDDMWKMKQWPTVKKAYRSVDLETLLKDQNLPYDVSVYGTTAIGAFRVEKDNVSELLQQFYDNGFRFFFCTDKTGVPVLHGGILMDRSEGKCLVVSTGVNLIEDKDLKRVYADKVRIHAISTQGMNGKKISVEVGSKDKDANEYRIYATGKTEEELRAYAEAKLTEYQRDGLAGKLTTFGGRLVGLLDHVAVKIDAQRRGIYQIEANEISFGTEGYRQTITLGRKTGN